MRKKLSHVIFAMIVGGLFYIGIYPFMFEYHKVKDFCDALAKTPTRSLDDVKAQAVAQGFRVSDSDNNEPLQMMLIYDARTLGKTTCFVTQENGKLVLDYMAE